MKNYPDPVTRDLLPEWDHITDVGVATDIADTEDEIGKFTALMEAERTIAEAHPDATKQRLAEVRASAWQHEITERRAFIAFLRRIQAARQERAESKVPA